ncbi:MAG TPA: MFS transporter [Solirubrobacteraceae bacterium]|nr:MFS transporter [Solirubrobacteraceae bacterium]
MTATSRKPSHAGAILALVLAGQFLVVLDVSIVNVALPSMQEALGFSDAGLQWAVNAYTIAFAGFLLLGGRLADLFGHRRALLAGLSLFAVGSLLGGVAESQGVLIAGRAIQGLGGAVLSPATLTILTTTFREGPERANALGWWMAVGAAGGAVGGLAGGVLTEVLSWRWVLLVNAPIAIAVLLATLRVIPADAARAEGEPRARLDVAGAVTATAGLAAVVLGIVQSVDHGWGAAATLVPLLLGVALLAVFVLVEDRFAAAPLMPLSILRYPGLATANVVMLLSGTAFFAIWFFVSIYQQQVLGMSSIEAGAGFLPHTLALIASSQIATRYLAGRDPRKVISGGLLLSALGFLWQAQASADGSYFADVFGPGIVLCFGAGLTFGHIAGAATAGVPAQLAGLASGLINASRMFGGALGLAALTTIAAGAATEVGGFDRAFTASGAVLVLTAAVAWLLPAPDRVRTAREPVGQPAEA